VCSRLNVVPVAGLELETRAANEKVARRLCFLTFPHVDGKLEDCGTSREQRYHPSLFVEVATPRVSDTHRHFPLHLSPRLVFARSRCESSMCMMFSAEKKHAVMQNDEG